MDIKSQRMGQIWPTYAKASCTPVFAGIRGMPRRMKFDACNQKVSAMALARISACSIITAAS